MPSFSQIHHALLAVKEPSAGFPFGKEWTPDVSRELRRSVHFSEWLEDMRRTARLAAETPIPPLLFSDFVKFETAGTRMEYESPYFERRERLAALVLASLIDETDEYIPALENLIWEICNEFTWALPAHLPRGEEYDRGRVSPYHIVDLFAAETARALAETLFLMKRRLSKKIEIRVHQEIERRIVKPVFHGPIRFGWEFSRNNWAAVCAGAVGMAMMLLERNRERLAGMLDRVIRTMECFLEGFGEYGRCAEGIAYWQYGFGYYVYFAEMLNEYTNGEIDLLRGEKIVRIAEFPYHIGLSGSMFANYSDSLPSQELNTGLVCKLASRCGARIPEMRRVTPFHADHCYRFAALTRNLLWTDASMFHRPWETGTYHLSDLSWVVDRRKLAGATVAFSAKGGHNDEPHNHNDLGHFILHVDGVNVLADLGTDRYTREYFGPNRYSILHNSSEGHSVPLINGNPQLAGRQFAASEVRCEPHAEGVFFELDLTRAYEDAGIACFTRSFDWRCDGESRAAYLQLTDVFAFREKLGELEELFISLNKPEMRDNQIVWSLPRGQLLLTFDASEFSARIEELKKPARGPFGGFASRISDSDEGRQPERREMECRFLFALTLF